ncbi:MAG: EF hand/EF hand [Verrucomicrobia bacterium]|nr:MAG: EF hand/EF hand [Verrucomicrobiota bacterium]
MKKQIILAAVTALAFTSIGFAAEGEGKPKGGKKPPMTPELRAEGMIKNLDKDADGKLDKAELAAQPAHKPKPDAPAPTKPAPSPEERAAKMIEKGDKDADGKLDKAELVAVLTATPKKPKAQ